MREASRYFANDSVKPVDEACVRKKHQWALTGYYSHTVGLAISYGLWTDGTGACAAKHPDARNPSSGTVLDGLVSDRR